MAKKVLIQVYLDDSLRDFIKEAAERQDRTVSSYVRIKMRLAAERDLGVKYNRVLKHSGVQ